MLPTCWLSAVGLTSRPRRNNVSSPPLKDEVESTVSKREVSTHTKESKTVVNSLTIDLSWYGNIAMTVYFLLCYIRHCHAHGEWAVTYLMWVRGESRHRPVKCNIHHYDQPNSYPFSFSDLLYEKTSLQLQFQPNMNWNGVILHMGFF